MSELLGLGDSRKVALKGLIRELHEGADPEEAKRRSAALLRTLSATEIAQIEGELIDEGMSREEIQRLCDVHITVFKESLERGEAAAPLEHPIELLKKEHELLLQLGGELRAAAGEVVAAGPASAAAALERFQGLVGQIKGAHSHYLREENVLFPYLEKHGVTQPPAIMWSEHDRIRAIEKELHGLLEGDTGDYHTRAGRLEAVAGELAGMFASHFYKENNILFPTAMKLMTEGEWQDTAEQFAEIGYWRVVPPPPAATKKPAEPSALSVGEEALVTFETGTVPLRALEVILNALPVEVTYVDAENTVRYFSQPKERIFPRLKAVIGRKVEGCHPEKSVHVVNEIVESFRSGARDSAQFWIQSGGRFLVITFYALRSEDGEYLGCLEVTQDATGLRQLEGERRLLDWE